MLMRNVSYAKLGIQQNLFVSKSGKYER